MRIGYIGTSMIAMLAALTAPGAALAEEQPGATTAGSTTESGLGDIIVTARKVSERLQDVPVAITAFDATALERQNATSLSDVARAAPGLTIITQTTNGSSVAFFTLRGQTQRSNLATTDPSIGVYVDGVYWARAYGINANLMDVGNLQVLRGPQGTLFGRNTTGGAILITTNDPVLDEFSGKISASAGRFNYRAGTAVVNVPLSEGKVAGRLAFQTIDDSGYVTDRLHPGFKYGEQSNYAFRAKMLAELGENTSLLLSYDAFRESRRPDTGELIFVTSTSNSNFSAGAEIAAPGACAGAGALTCIANGRARIASIINGYKTDGTDRVVSSNIINESNTKTDTFVATLNHSTGIGDLKFIGGYRRIRATFYADYDGSEVRLTEYSGNNDIDQWSGELQLTGKTLDDRLTYAGGLFYFTEHGRDKSDFAALSAINTRLSRFDGVIDNKSIGIYGQATYQLTDALSFTGGLRWSQDKKAVTIRNGQVSGTIYLPTPGSFTCTVTAGCPLTRRGKFDGVSWTAGLEFKPAPDILLYAKAARAFRSGGVNLRETNLVNNLPPQAFLPEQATSFEGGIKADLLGRRLRVNLAGFYQILDDAQREFILSTGNTNTTVAGNAGRADYYGGEAEITARVIDAADDTFTLSGNVAYIKPEYKDYKNPQNGFDKSRELFAFVPEWTVSVSGTFEHRFENSRLTATATYNWDSGFPFSEFNYYIDGAGVARNVSECPNPVSCAAQIGSPIPLADAQGLKDAMHVDKSGTLDLRLALAMGPDERYEVALWGKNVFNDRTIVSTGTVVTLAINGVRRAPATYGITGTVKF